MFVCDRHRRHPAVSLREPSRLIPDEADAVIRKALDRERTIAPLVAILVTRMEAAFRG